MQDGPPEPHAQRVFTAPYEREGNREPAPLPVLPVKITARNVKVLS